MLFSSWDVFLGSVTVSSFIPGRIRCYSSLIENNQSNAEILRGAFAGIPAITEFKINVRTGSVLIVYSPDRVSESQSLRRIESALHSKFLDLKKIR
mgnify:CR=1 FL=1